MTRISPRSWLLLSLPVGTLLALVVLLMLPSVTSLWPHNERLAPAEPLVDRALPGGGTAQLSKCGSDDGPRPAPHGAGERDRDPQLAFASWGVHDPGPKAAGEPTFTVQVVINTGDRPLELDAPVAKGRVTVDLYGPHGEGRRASARGLTATVVGSGYRAKPVEVPPSGRFRVAPGKELRLDVNVPAEAICPSRTMDDVISCTPEHTNDAADCPVMTLTLSDPAIRAYRAAGAEEGDTGPFSDRLVAVSLEPDLRVT
ncbi:hypothetical protein [Streptomyces sp. NPDC002133]|uniref:hypothetical protein n=1 Tax=Streptomyces sp. NPDC002133 TaxID=3154409 RepID=UPI00332DB1AF